MGRYTDAQRQGIMQNRRDRAAGLRYGYSLEDQGYKNAPEQGASAFALDKFKGQFGGGADPTWDTRVGPDGRVQYRAKGQNPDRQQVFGTDWFDASKINPNIQKRYERMQDFKNEYGADKSFQDFSMWRGGNIQANAQNWQTDPTGQFRFNPNNPSDRRDMMGRRIADSGAVMGMGAGTSGQPMNYGGTVWDGYQQGGQLGALPGNSGGVFNPVETGGIVGPQSPAAFDPNDPYGLKKRREASQANQGTLGSLGY